MSLVICSNIREETLTNRLANYEAAFSFHNALKQTLQIEPNSEVAVQSVKINKSANIILKKSDTWYEFFGKDLHLTQTTSNAGIYRTIFCTPDLKGLSSKVVTMEEFAEIMARSCNIGMPHPDVYGLLKFEIDRDATTNAYKGFKVITTYQNDNGTNLEKDTSHFNNVSYWANAYDYVASALTVTAAPDGITFNKNAGIVQSQEGCQHMINGFPLSHQGGVLKYNVKGMRNVATGGSGYGTRPFQVGLCRAMLLDNSAGNPDAEKGWIGPYDPTHNTNLGNVSTAFGANYYDVVVSNEQVAAAGNYKLKVHQATRNVDGTISLTEVLYYGYAGATHANILDMSQSPGLDLVSINFTLENEILNISYSDSKGAIVDICNFTKDLAAGAKKENLLCPIGQTRWNLYPKICIVGTAAVPTSTNLYIEEYTAHINTYNNWSIRNPDNNYYARMESRSEFGELLELDTRDMYNMAINPTAVPSYTPEGITSATGINTFTNRAIQLIFAPSLTLYSNTQNANMAAQLGFEQSPVLAPSINGTVNGTDPKEFTYTSDSASELFNTASLFVRLDNFTQTSYNAGVGRPSKILYHLPRFDTSNRDLGTGLYFEPTERTYVALNNSDTLYMNTVDISISNDNEQLATDLVGKTIVVLHFRKSPNLVNIDKNK
jgi:hypothetical protein